MRRVAVFSCLAAFILTPPAAIAQQPAPPPGQTDPPPQPEHPVVKQVRELLAAGQLTEALKLSEQKRQADPDDKTLRALYVQLRMSLAHTAITSQQFAQAEALLKQVVAAEPKHQAAVAMLAEIAQARGRVEGALADAAALLKIERFEQSAALLAQVAGLLPDQPNRWKESWLTAVTGAGDDHYLMHNYDSALPFYSQAIELAGGVKGGRVSEQLLWRWAHCYSMNLAHSASVKRTAVQWQMIIDQARDAYDAADAVILGRFVAALGRDNLGDYHHAVSAYKLLLGANAPAVAAGGSPRAMADAMRGVAIRYVDSLNRSNLIRRRGGAWATALPGPPKERKSQRVVVQAHNDLAARRVLETVEYHAPRLLRYLGGDARRLDWSTPLQVLVEPKLNDEATLLALAVPSYTRITSQGGRLVRHQITCYQTDPLLLGATVPHELAHVLIHRLSGYATVPLALDEGLAIHAETTARYLMFRRSLMEGGGPKLGVAQLLAVGELPPFGQRAAFYAECYNLVAWLLTRGGPADVIRAAALTRQLNPMAAVMRPFKIATADEAEKAYHTFLVDQGLLPPPGQ